MGPQQCCVSHRINTCDLSIQVTVFKSLLIGKASVISWDVFHLWWRPSVIFYCSNESFFIYIYILLAWAGTWSHCDHSINLWCWVLWQNDNRKSRDFKWEKKKDGKTDTFLETFEIVYLLKWKDRSENRIKLFLFPYLPICWILTS